MDFTVDGARIEQDVPLEELQRALHRALTDGVEPAARAVERSDALLRAYAGQHLRATTVANGAPWTIDVQQVTGHDASDGPRARFFFVLRPPPGQASASLKLRDDIVAHEVVSHYTAVYLRSDWSAGAALDQARLVGTIHAGHFDILLAREGSFLRGLRGVVALGAAHIATGTDHLIFLFALLLVAPVVAQGGRWQTRRGTADAVLGVVRVVSAFTIGHSATLALGALGAVTVPPPAIEAAIAASILITACHALRPLFPRGEALIAGLFGLIHGLAFASSLVGRDLGRAQAIWTLFGFNLGIELAQIGLLALVVPWLLILARTGAYAAFRIGGAVLAATLAAGWLVERTTGLPNPAAPVAACLQAHPLGLLVSLAGVAMLARAAISLDLRQRGPTL